MRIFALELNNDIKGIERRKEYIETLIKQLPAPDLVVLPELALCSYMASREIWQYADDCGVKTSAWSVAMAKKYHTYIGTGYLDKEAGNYFNRYMIAGSEVVICPKRRVKDIRLHGEDILPGNWLFKHLILEPDTKAGILSYEANR